DRLVIGRFCALATGVRFIMNGANHALGGFSTYPFNIFGHGWEEGLDMAQFTDGLRGDTVVGNDVWIGREATLLQGVKICDDVIIGKPEVVVSYVPIYVFAVGNPYSVIR